MVEHLAAAARARLWDITVEAAVVADESGPAAMHRERDRAVAARDLVPAVPAQQHRSPAPPVHQQDRLLAARQRLCESLAETAGQESLAVLTRLGRLAFQVHDLHDGKTAAGDALRKVEHRHPALRRQG